MKAERKPVLVLVALVLLAFVVLGLSSRAISATYQNAQFTQFTPVNDTVVITAQNNGYNVSNATLITPFSFTLNGSTFSVYVSYIAQGSAIISMNGSTYLLSLHKPNLIRRSRTNNFYVQVTSVSYSSKPNTVNLFFYSTGHLPTPILNSTYNINPNSTTLVQVPGTAAIIELNSQTRGSARLVIANFTTSITTTPPDYNPILVLNLTTISSSNVTTSLAVNYPCLANPDSFAPFKLMPNGSWTQLVNFTTNVAACNITFAVPADPVVGLFQMAQPISLTSTPTTTAAPSTTIVPIVVSTTIIQSMASLPSYDWAAVSIVIIIILIILYIALTKKKPVKTKEAKQRE